jgi:serine/threonine-protein kinase
MGPGIRLLGDRYELLDLLASGGMGRVWRTRDRLLDRLVAVKVLRSEFTGNPAFLARFRAEAQHAAALHHPHIASVFDYGEAEVDGERVAYLVMELVDGESLSQLLQRERRLDVPRTLAVLRSTAAALGAAHAAGLVHRDVKPGNVLVAADGTVKITDFGIAWSASSVPLTQTGQVIGTAHYLSPEQAVGGKATPASDVYALGAVAYECLAGRRAFEGENAVQIVVKHIHEHPEPLPPDVPVEVRRIIGRAMAKDPAERFPDGAALRNAVDAVLAGEPRVARSPTGTAVLPLPVLEAGAAPPAAAGRSARWAAGRRAAAGALAAIVAVLVVAAVAIGMNGGGGAPPAAGTSGPSSGGTPEQVPETPRPVEVAAADYVGRPVSDVQAELVDLGLVPLLEPVQTDDTPEGQVTGIEPRGELAAGSAVTVSHAVAPSAAPRPPAEDEPAEDDGNDRGNEGKGNGNGNGKGKGNGDGNGRDRDD